MGGADPGPLAAIVDPPWQDGQHQKGRLSAL
jgi:hypothetical protein